MGGGEQQIAGSCASEESQIDTLEHREDNVSVHVLTHAALTTVWKGALFSTNRTLSDTYRRPRPFPFYYERLNVHCSTKI